MKFLNERSLTSTVAAALLAAALSWFPAAPAWAQAPPAPAAPSAPPAAAGLRAPTAAPSPAPAPAPRPAPPPVMRVRDMAHVSGTNSNPLVGYGMVVGLNQTGDTQGSVTQQMLKRMLQTLGMNVPQENGNNTSALRVKNVAVVTITSNLPPYARPGDNVDVLVSSMGDAKSLEGGVLVMSLLKGADGQVYANAQGPVQVANPDVSGIGIGAVKSHTTAGIVRRGGLVCKGTGASVASATTLSWVLDKPDFDVASRIATAITAYLPGIVAVARDSSTVEVNLGAYAAQGPMVDVVARIGNVPLDLPSPGPLGPVMFDVKGGGVTQGGDVRLRPGVAQYGPTRVTVEDGSKAVTVSELVQDLEMMGVPAQDRAEVLRILKRTRMLDAELTIL